MQQTYTSYYADSNCPYTLDGVHLTSLRRAVLARIAPSLDIDPDQPKNKLVEAMMIKLRALEAESEISSLVEETRLEDAPEDVVQEKVEDEDTTE